MPEPHLDKLYAYYPNIIDLMPDRFSSHEFIERLFQQHQADFIDALYKYRSLDAPVRSLTAPLSKQLHNHPRLVQYDGHEQSKNLFSDEGQCAVWVRKKQAS
ncbi:hypothetical protein OT109_06115 [Phycisphaeraceae bacterium D3-23]